MSKNLSRWAKWSIYTQPILTNIALYILFQFIIRFNRENSKDCYMRVKESIIAFVGIISILVSLSGICSCSKQCAEEQKTIFLKAFSDVYGCVRWFYPGDEAQDADWNYIALEGVKQIEAASSKENLQEILQNIFYPIAPGVVISKEPHYNTELITPTDISGMKEIAWQHYGVELGKWSNTYVSKRTHRSHNSQGVNRFVMELEFAAADYMGKDLTLCLDIDNKTPSSLTVYAKISLNDNTPDQYINFCEFTPQHIIAKSYKERIKVSNRDANKLLRIGIYTQGVGEFAINQCSLSTKNQDIDLRKTPHRRNTHIYNYSDNCSVISTRDRIFEEQAHIGDVNSIEIVDGLYAHIPLALYGTDEYTYPTLSASDKHVNTNSNYTEYQKMVADLIVTWNVIKYFHPYLSDEVKDWDSCLLSTLKECEFADKFTLNPIRHLMANVNDAHCVANSPCEEKSYGFMPIRVKKSGNKVVVTQSTLSTIHPGDEVASVGNRRAIELYTECEKLVSGSPQYKSYRAELIWLRQEAERQKLHLVRDKQRISVDVERIAREEFIATLLSNNNAKASQWIDSNTLYINTGSSDLSQIKELLKTRSVEQTVLIDIRNGSRFLLASILPLISDKEDLIPTRAGISQIPKVYMPQSPTIKDCTTNIDLPTLKYNNIFITGAMNYSHDEEVVDYALYCGIATTAGEATAGCNGRINSIPLPSGGSVIFTGTKVFSNLGMQGYYYGKGIATHSSHPYSDNLPNM